jgi:hypothetical protein
MFVLDNVEDAELAPRKHRLEKSLLDVQDCKQEKKPRRSSPPRGNMLASTPTFTRVFVGRRVVTAYSITRGTVFANEEATFKLEGDRDALLKKRKVANKHKHRGSGAQLLFRTRNLSGRLPDRVCSFLVPLIRSKAVTVQGRIEFEQAVGVFQVRTVRG